MFVEEKGMQTQEIKPNKRKINYMTETAAQGIIRYISKRTYRLVSALRNK